MNFCASDDLLTETSSAHASKGNALPEVQAEVDFICGTNDEDGLAKFLEERFL